MPRFRGDSTKCEPIFSERFDFSASSVTSGQSVTSRSKLTPSSFFIYELTFIILLLLHRSLAAEDRDHMWLSSKVFGHEWHGSPIHSLNQIWPFSWCSAHGALTFYATQNSDPLSPVSHYRIWKPYYHLTAENLAQMSINEMSLFK